MERKTKVMSCNQALWLILMLILPLQTIAEELSYRSQNLLDSKSSSL